MSLSCEVTLPSSEERVASTTQLAVKRSTQEEGLGAEWVHCIPFATLNAVPRQT